MKRCGYFVGICVFILHRRYKYKEFTANGNFRFPYELLTVKTAQPEKMLETLNL